jgi:uncharacterized membrane protein
MSTEDSIKAKLDKIYHNYGIYTSEMTDEEYNRLISYYIDNPKELDVDYKKSVKYAEQFPEEKVV